MSESIRISGKTVSEAVMNAAIRLGCSSDHIEYTVIERESRGFLGIGAKDAVIEAKVKEEGQEAENAVPSASDPEIAAAPEREQSAEQEPEKAERDASVKAEPKTEEETASEVKDSEDRTEASPAVGSADQSEASPAQTQARKHKGSDIRVLDDPSEAIARAEKFLRDVYGSMGMDVKLTSEYDGECLNVSMEGDEMGLLIGKRGQTLDSLQYLTSLVVNKGKPYYVRVKLDTENYRERRKATLENLAKNIAVKVKKTRQPVSLEPMNPYERRIIHSALQGDPFVTTHSEGEEPDRRVVVTLKSDADLEALDRKYGERRNGYRGGNGRGGYRGGRSGGRGAYRSGRSGSRRYSESGYGEDRTKEQTDGTKAEEKAGKQDET